MPGPINMNVLQAKQAMENFRMFSYASGKTDTVAMRNAPSRADDQGTFTIVPNTSFTNKPRWPFGRTATDKANNETVRTIFLQAVLILCNAKNISELPKSIRKALEIENYGKTCQSNDGVVSGVSGGKPLTSRRIGTVIAALKKERKIDYREADGNGSISLTDLAVQSEYTRQQKETYQFDDDVQPEPVVQEESEPVVQEEPEPVVQKESKPVVRKNPAVRKDKVPEPGNKVVRNKPAADSTFSERLAFFNKGVAKNKIGK